MKKILKLTLLLTIFLAVVGTASAETNIAACTTLNTANETYLLTANIVNDDNNCMVIGADNITLDCQSNTIDGDADAFGAGVYNSTLMP